jgi:hypothetical protein
MGEVFVKTRVPSNSWKPSRGANSPPSRGVFIWPPVVPKKNGFGLEVGGEPGVEALEIFGEIYRRMHVRRNQRRLVEGARHHAGVNNRNGRSGRGRRW